MSREQTSGKAAARGSPLETRARARQIHQSALVVDGHNDLPWRLRSQFRSSFERFDLAGRHPDGHTDIPRLREGGVGAQFFAAFVPSEYEGRGAARVALEQIDLIHRMVGRYPELELAVTADQAREAHRRGKIVVLAAVEGGHAIENSLGVLRNFARLGARYMTLTHASTTDWADAATDEPVHGGLSEFGEQVVREMNRLGMLVDISHVSVETMAQVLQISQAPVIASHSGAHAINDHPRNVPDEILRRLAANGGVVMVNFSSGFLVPEAADVVRDMFDVRRELRAEAAGDETAFEAGWLAWLEAHPVPRGSVAHVADHIEHIVSVAGIDHVGLGSDFDGISVVPEGLEDVSRFPEVTEELVRRGYTEGQIRKILGENVLRVLAAAEARP